MLTEFLKDFKSVVISTIDKETNPFSSYAPFIKYEDNYYVFLSAMAKHWENLQLHKKASLFFVEDEKSCENIFARKRVVMQGNVSNIDKQTNQYNTILNEFENIHGETVKVLRKMDDFTLFEISPFSGEAIFGFGAAYNLGGEKFNELVQRENTKGHGKR